MYYNSAFISVNEVPQNEEYKTIAQAVKVAKTLVNGKDLVEVWNFGYFGNKMVWTSANERNEFNLVSRVKISGEKVLIDGKPSGVAKFENKSHTRAIITLNDGFKIYHMDGMRYTIMEIAEHAFGDWK